MIVTMFHILEENMKTMYAADAEDVIRVAESSAHLAGTCSASAAAPRYRAIRACNTIRV